MKVTRDDLKKLLLDAGIGWEIVAGLKQDVPLAQQGIDSLDYPVFLETIRDSLGVVIGNEDVWTLKTLNDFEAFLNRRN